MPDTKSRVFETYVISRGKYSQAILIPFDAKKAFPFNDGERLTMEIKGATLLIKRVKI